MKFQEFVEFKAIRASIESQEKEGVIKELVASLVESGVIEPEQQEGIITAIMNREELGSTGIGRGVAVPHTKHGSVDNLVGTVGVSVDGIDFDSLDGEKVHLVFLLVSPPERHRDHLRALENITRQLKNDTLCRFLMQSKTLEDIQQLLEEADDNQFV